MGKGAPGRWHEVENFFDSGQNSRHYMCDPIKGEITFGDGRKGWVPPTGRDSVKCEYRLGGGVAGNVGPKTLTVLKQSVAFVQSVRRMALQKKPGIAETLDWTAALLRLGITTIDKDGAERILETLSALIKTRDDRAAFPRDVVARLAAAC